MREKSTEREREIESKKKTDSRSNMEYSRNFFFCSNNTQN